MIPLGDTYQFYQISIMLTAWNHGIPSAGMRIASMKKEEHRYPFQNLVRFATFSQNPEKFVLVILGTKRGYLLKRGIFSSLHLLHEGKHSKTTTAYSKKFIVAVKNDNLHLEMRSTKYITDLCAPVQLTQSKGNVTY